MKIEYLQILTDHIDSFSVAYSETEEYMKLKGQDNKLTMEMYFNCLIDILIERNLPIDDDTILATARESFI